MIWTLVFMNLIAGVGMVVGTTTTPGNTFAIIMQVLFAVLFLSNAGVMIKRSVN